MLLVGASSSRRDRNIVRQGRGVLRERYVDLEWESDWNLNYLVDLGLSSDGEVDSCQD